MNKLTKLLSVFVIAGAVGTGVTFAAGCGHKHSFSGEWTNDDPEGHYYAATCEHSGEKKDFGEHVDEKINATDAEGKDYLCDVCGYDLSIKVSGITLTSKTLQITTGGSAKLTYTLAPDNATNKEVEWTSDKPDIATVDSDGKVTAKSAGVAKITVKAKDGDVSDTCTVTVTPAQVAVTGIKLDHNELTLKKGESKIVTATVEPSTATNKERTRVSSNENVATVDASGTITAVGVGEATITVTTVDGGFKATCKVTVIENTAETTPVEKVELRRPTLELEVGQSDRFEAIITPSNATNQHVSYESSDSTVVEIIGDEGNQIRALKVGEATITVTTEDGNHTATCVVTVKEATSGTVHVTGIKLDYTELNLKKGESKIITATIEPSTATEKERTRVSSNENVATIDSNGTVTAVGVGTATITITTVDGGFKATCVVNVTENTSTAIPVQDVDLRRHELKLTVGQTDRFVAIIKPENASNQHVSYASSDSTVVEVIDNGNQIRALKAGTATITVTTEDGNHTATCVVTVEDEIKTRMSEADFKAAIKATIDATNYTAVAGTNKISFDAENNIIYLESDYGTMMYVYNPEAKTAYQAMAFGKDNDVIIKDSNEMKNVESFAAFVAALNSMTGTPAYQLKPLLEFTDYATEVEFNAVTGAYTYGTVTVTFLNGKVESFKDPSAEVPGYKEVSYSKYGTTEVTVAGLDNAYENRAVMESAKYYIDEENPEYKYQLPTGGVAAGLYAKYKNNDNYIEATENGFKQTVKQGGEGQEAFISLALMKGEIKGYFELSTDKLGRNWDIIQFVQIVGDSDKKKFCVNMCDSNGTLKYNMGDSNADTAQTAPETAVALPVNTTIKVAYKLVKEESGNYKLTLTLDGKAFVTEKDIGTDTIDKIVLPASNIKNGPRVLTIDNVLVCGEKLSATEYLPIAQADLEKAYYEMVGKAAEGTDPAIVGTHTRNAEEITTRYQEINFEEMGDIDSMISAIEIFKAMAEHIDSDAEIEAEITKLVAHIASVNTDHAGEYTVEGEGCNKEQFENLIASLTNEVKDGFMRAQEVTDWQTEFDRRLDEIETDTEYAEHLLKDAKDGANGYLCATWEAFLETDSEVSNATEAIKNTVKTAWDTAKTAVANAGTVDAVNSAMNAFDAAKSNALASGNLDSYKTSNCNNLATYANTEKNKLDDTADADLIQAIEAEQLKGTNAINAESVTDNDGVDAAYNAAVLAIDKLVAKDSLTKAYNNAVAQIGTAKTNAEAEIHGSSDAATTATNAVADAENAVKDYDKATVIANLEAATAETLGTLLGEATTAIENLLSEQQTAITNAMNTLKATDFTVTLEGNTGATAAKVTYGGKVVIDESAVADNVMIKGWKLGSEAYDFDAPVYGDITLTPETAESIKTQINNAFSYSAIKTDGFADRDYEGMADDLEGAKKGDNVILANTDFEGTANAFLNINESGLVTWRKSNSCIQNRNGGLSFVYAGGDTVTLTIEWSSTGGSNESRLGLQKDGSYIVATTAGGTLITEGDDAGAYSMTGTTKKTTVFTLTEAGTYTIWCPDATTTRGARIFNVKLNGYSKVEKVAVNGVTIEGEATRTIDNVGDTLKLVATIAPANANEKGVTWSSSNDAVATVAQDGTVTAVAQGLVTITVTSKENSELTTSVTIDVAGFATAVQAAVEEINNKTDAEITSAGNDDKLATLKTEIIAKIVVNGEPQISTGAQLTTILTEFETKCNALKTTQVKLTMNYEGGSKDEDVPANGSLALYAPAEAEEAKAGYKLVGWKDASGADFDFATSTIAADTVITAQYEAVTVTFNLDGGAGETDTTVSAEGKVTKPADPTKTDFDFAGWYNGNVEYDFDTVLYDNVTITAKWTAKVKAKQTLIYSQKTEATDNEIDAKDTYKIGDEIATGNLFTVNAKSALTAGTVTKGITGWDVNGTATATEAIPADTTYYLQTADLDKTNNKAELVSITAKDKDITVKVLLLSGKSGGIDTIRSGHYTYKIGTGAETTVAFTSAKKQMVMMEFTLKAGESALVTVYCDETGKNVMQTNLCGILAEEK